MQIKKRILVIISVAVVAVVLASGFIGYKMNSRPQSAAAPAPTTAPAPASTPVPTSSNGQLTLEKQVAKIQQERETESKLAIQAKEYQEKLIAKEEEYQAEITKLKDKQQEIQIAALEKQIDDLKAEIERVRQAQEKNRPPYIPSQDPSNWPPYPSTPSPYYSYTMSGSPVTGDFKVSVYDKGGWFIGSFRESTIDHYWASGGPQNRIDNFSVKWAGTFSVSTDGQYQFDLVADDAAELYIDGVSVIPSAFASRNSRYLKSGTHKLTLKYYESTGESFVRLYWQKIG